MAHMLEHPLRIPLELDTHRFPGVSPLSAELGILRRTTHRLAPFPILAPGLGGLDLEPTSNQIQVMMT